MLQRDPDISANTTGDEELEAMLKAEAINRRNESMAQNRGPPGRGPPPGGHGGPPGRGPPPGGPGGPPPGRGPPPGHPGGPPG